MTQRMPPMETSRMTEAQRKAAADLIAGPRKAVVGPFIALLRSPELLDRMQRVGEYLRFHNAIPQKLVELAILATARHVDNAFEWVLHQPLAMKEGVAHETIGAINAGKRPAAMPEDEAAVLDFVRELLETSFVSDAAYDRVAKLFGEQGVVDLTGTVGYFVAVCYVMNVAGTPPPASDAAPLAAIRR
ncbi:MAG: carboxymuconolactone decarboxylase family protein [Burkholderiales bacterium]|nr:carboxymuconolactone decarboxylase family protein [Burkholderiales bacterium]